MPLLSVSSRELRAPPCTVSLISHQPRQLAPIVIFIFRMKELRCRYRLMTCLMSYAQWVTSQLGMGRKLMGEGSYARSLRTPSENAVLIYLPRWWEPWKGADGRVGSGQTGRRSESEQDAWSRNLGQVTPRFVNIFLI